MRPEDIIATYDTVAADFARNRDKTLFERRWLDRMLAHAVGRRVLDLGCGPGKPIAQYLNDRRAQVTGVDASANMTRLFAQTLPGAEVHLADMRGLRLNQSFDAILAWDSFFHLSPNDQRAMFPIFAAHCHPGTVLMFTSGHRADEPVGQVEGKPVYHASLEPAEYRSLLAENGFEVIDFVREDKTCGGHTIWLTRYAPPIA